jgi:hypothetical protein
MPAFSYWFSGAAFAAFIALLAAVGTLGYGWYRAALSEMQTAEKEASARNQAAANNRALVLQRLTQEYIWSRDNSTPALAAGTERPPSDWMNRRLQEMGLPWRVEP